MVIFGFVDAGAEAWELFKDTVVLIHKRLMLLVLFNPIHSFFEEFFTLNGRFFLKQGHFFSPQLSFCYVSRAAFAFSSAHFFEFRAFRFFPSDKCL